MGRLFANSAIFAVACLNRLRGPWQPEVRCFRPFSGVGAGAVTCGTLSRVAKTISPIAEAAPAVAKIISQVAGWLGVPRSSGSRTASGEDTTKPKRPQRGERDSLPLNRPW
jgi:hypothetical protein